MRMNESSRPRMNGRSIRTPPDKTGEEAQLDLGIGPGTIRHR